MSELVSVVIPSYNHARFLPEAVATVFRQTYPDSEIVVVDDGSTDRTAEVVKEYPRVRYLRQHRQGLSAARNAGLRACRGEYVVFLDADDRLLPNHFEVSMRAFRARPDAALVCGDFRLFGSEEQWHMHCCEPRPDHYASLLRCNFIGAVHSVMFRRVVVDELGGFSPHLHACEDYELYFRIARTHPIYCHHELVAEYRRYGSQLSRQWDVMLASALSVLRAQWPHVKGHPQYVEAYRDGTKRFRTVYGDPLLWQMVFVARQRRWRTAFKYLRVLLACYPAGLAGLLRQKLLRRRFTTIVGNASAVRLENDHDSHPAQ